MWSRRGTLRVAGYDVVTQPIDVKRRIAYVPDDPQLFSHLSVEEHLAFTAAAYGVADADARAAALLADFPEILSGGVFPEGECVQVNW